MKHKKQKPALDGRVEGKILDLREFATAPRAAARNDGAATGRGHAGAKAQFASARALFRLIGAFHWNSSFRLLPRLASAPEKRPQFNSQKYRRNSVETLTPRA